MSAFMDRLTRRAAYTWENPSAPMWESFGGAPTYSGKRVTPASALALVPVFSAVTLLAGAVGSLPCVTYERLAQGRRRADNHRLASVLHTKPNDVMAADELWAIVEASLDLWGNAYLVKERNQFGLVKGLLPLAPHRVGFLNDKGQRDYSIDGVPGFSSYEILHIRGLSFDGGLGISPITQARQAVGNHMALEEFQGRFWRNNARPGVVLKHPGELSDQAAKRLRKSWEAMHGGLANAARTAVLEEGMDVQALGMPLEDAQFIEQAQMVRSDVALLFRVPPHMLAAGTGDSLTYATTEGHSLDFLRWTLRPRLARIEGAINADPDLFPQGQRFYAEFLVDALLRASTKERYEAYAVAIDKGFLHPDEVRELENRMPLTEQQKQDLAPRLAPGGTATSSDTEPDQ